jgi:YD repeat-containing protein
MKKLFILAGVLTALTISSCKKDKSGPEPNPGNGATLLLKKVTEKKDGVTTIHTLTYDANKRLVSVISNDNIEKVFFTYDNNGNLTKIEETEDEFKNIYTYTYTNNIPVSGAFKSWHKQPGMEDELIEDDLITYTVENNQVTKMHLEMTQDDYEMDLAFTYGNGNLTKVQSTGGVAYTATFTYGTKKPAYPKVTTWVLDQAGFSLLFSSRNEILNSSFDFPGNQYDKSISNIYTYNANGYPITMNDGESQYTYEYE